MSHAEMVTLIVLTHLLAATGGFFLGRTFGQTEELTPYEIGTLYRQLRHTPTSEHCPRCIAVDAEREGAERG